MKLPIKKRNDVWHADFYFKDKRYRKSLKTSNKSEAKKKYFEMLNELERENGVKKEQVKGINLYEAADQFDSYLSTQVSSNSHKRYMSAFKIFIDYLFD